MIFYALTGLLNAISSTILGLFVLFQNRKARVNQTFALFCLSVAMWSYAYYFWPGAVGKTTTLFWFQILHIGAIFIPVCYLHFVVIWLNIYQEKKRILQLGYLASFILCFFVFTPLFIKDMVPKFSFRYWAEPGILYHFFLFIFFTYAIYAFYLLLKTYRKSSGIQRAQLKYLLIGTVLGYLGGSTNYPLWYNINFPPVGNWTITLYLGLVAYAIIRYRLMDIRMVVGRGAIYIFSFGTVVGLAFLMMFLNNLLARPLSLTISGPLIIIVSLLVFQLVFRLFEKLASRYFYYTFYSYQQVLTNLGRNLARVLEIDKLSSLIVNTLIETMKLDRTVILLRNPETGNYQIKKNIGFREENGIALVRDNFLTQYLEKTQNPLVYEEISLIIRDTINKEEREKLENLRNNMKRIEAALCLPLLIEEKIIGMIVLGNKLSGDPYSYQDIELLTALSNQSSIAFQNARLYSQIQDLSQNLQIRVEAQTKELRQAYEELKVLDKAKSEFISMASHQLRTPLTAIKGYISMLIEGSYGKLPEKVSEKIRHVFYSNERLIQIVNTLLNISKIELGKIEIEKQPTQVEDLIQDCYDELKIEAEKKNLKLIYQKPKKLLPKINIDALKIRQVILNLIDNAIRYTQKGEIRIKVEKTNSSIFASVKDTGEGLTSEEKKSIFQGFTRGRAGLAHWIEGAGLGLYVAKKFLELHNGKIWAESPGKNRGSTFYVELPIE